MSTALPCAALLLQPSTLPSSAAASHLASTHPLCHGCCSHSTAPSPVPGRWAQLRVSQVSAFGFMTPGYRAYSDHYFDRGHKEVHFFINHDLMMEMQLWQRLQRSGILWLYTGSEGTT